MMSIVIGQPVGLRMSNHMDVSTSQKLGEVTNTIRGNNISRHTVPL